MQIMPEKITEIKSKLKKGEPEGEIKEQLRQEGYSEDEIRKAFLAHHYDMRSWYLFFGIAVTLFGVYKLFMQEGLLFLILGAVLLYTYVQERKRLKE